MLSHSQYALLLQRNRRSAARCAPHGRNQETREDTVVAVHTHHSFSTSTLNLMKAKEVKISWIWRFCVLLKSLERKGAARSKFFFSWGFAK